MEVEAQLREEIRKWSSRLDDSLKSTTPLGPKGTEFMTNVKAYQSDSIHFYEKNDLVRSFEALIWAWSWLEIGKQQGLLA